VIIGSDEAELTAAVSSARAEAVINKNSDKAAFSVFKALLFECIKGRDY
jgi:hypothetical protein